jgi:hypothetical protein
MFAAALGARCGTRGRVPPRPGRACSPSVLPNTGLTERIPPFSTFPPFDVWGPPSAVGAKSL